MNQYLRLEKGKGFQIGLGNGESKASIEVGEGLRGTVSKIGLVMVRVKL